MNQVRLWGDFRVFNLENWSYNDLEFGVTRLATIGGAIDWNNPTIIISVTRSFENWAASYVTWIDGFAERTKAKDRRLVELWHEYRGVIPNQQHHLVSFEDMLTEKGRRGLCESIGGDYAEDTSTVSTAGGGSSFSGLSVKGENLDVTNRVNHLPERLRGDFDELVAWF